MQQVPRGAELLVWDSIREWTDKCLVRNARNLRELHACVIQNVPMRVGYTGPISSEHFEIFCRLAWVWLRQHRGRVLVIEELADVTSPGKAPGAWGEIVRKGRHQCGSKIYACTQRPAESDKTIAGNADVIHCGRQSFPKDRKSISEYLDVDVAEVNAMQSLQWIERDMRTRALRRGTVKF